ncbi:non-structural maintenance of chromosomes element 4 homolog A-like isoform X1 [Bradysia coprophila]|uniref:non-structural maintenance of chromosomes element 4 homolog A-like isoform X1 n=1 Tax=Bradysia coprophila TaxID=38358 RepID=UPI00187D8194|nr:non-structural maintenance of chromosomes element 4 homolog A-like isoform X1 [Bradysia coprophila]
MASSDDNRRKSFARRSRYKELLELCSRIETTTENQTPIQTLTNVTDVVKCTDEIHTEGQCQERVENSCEVVMDAQIIKGAHEIVGSVVQKMGNTEIADDEFVAAINRTIGPSKDWNKLFEKLALGMSKTIVHSQSLFGTFDVETVLPQKEVKERRKRTPIKNSQQMKPIAVVQERKRKEEQEATTVNVIGNQIIQLYETNNNEPLKYYKLIIDPSNFMRTIQNAFQVSFLLRDGLVAIGGDADGYPTVRPVSESDRKKDAQNGSYQMICNLSTTLCDEMIKRYNITEPMITCTPDSDE